jgi:hypothetical protein
MLYTWIFAGTSLLLSSESRPEQQDPSTIVLFMYCNLSGAVVDSCWTFYAKMIFSAQLNPPIRENNKSHRVSNPGEACVSVSLNLKYCNFVMVVVLMECVNMHI